LNFNVDPRAAQAPPELVCDGSKRTGNAAPFLVAPYSGWTEIASFLDHDRPDYEVDGKIVISNGLVADASGGSESDMFPAYWSSDLRQFINYDGHNGYDFTISYQPVLAAGTGTVSFAGWTDSGYGNMVLIDHHNGYSSLYGHLSALKVKKGEKVVAGEEIGISGSTGRSSGPHLHFSVFHNCQVTDPYGWTGRGKDRLQSFDAEQSQYLWLPGHDPLVVNPPPHWPSFPSGIQLSAEKLTALGSATRNVPPADRLLLLQLPIHTPGETASPALALQRTDALVTEEADRLVPALDRLARAGLIDSFQALPAAAAVWIRGTASAAQLEALPGVASLAGVQPHDLRAAQTELAHSVLVQADTQSAPSLWPAGFRSALQTWRPVTTAVIGHALVAGAALPGQKVDLALQRGSRVVASGSAFSDAETGGFAATLHNFNGAPVMVQEGDSLHIASGSRTAEVSLPALDIQARSNHIVGRSKPGSTVAVEVADRTGREVWHTVLTVPSSGLLRAIPPFFLRAGTQVVASTADGAGDQVAASAYVPGLVLDVSTSSLSGWTVGSHPYVQILRAGHKVLTRKLHRSPDGAFALDLLSGHHGTHVKAGDILTIGSQWHRKALKVPDVKASLSNSSAARISGPSGVAATVVLKRASSRLWTRHTVLAFAGGKALNLPQRLKPGDDLTVTAHLANGDDIQASRSVQSLNFFLGTGVIRGTAAPGTEIEMHALSRSGKVVAQTIAPSDAVTGTLIDQLQDGFGGPATFADAATIVVDNGIASRRIRISGVSVSISSDNRAFAARLPGRSSAVFTIQYSHRTFSWKRTASRSGRISVRLPRASGLQRVIMSVPVGDGTNLIRIASLVARHPAPHSRAHQPKSSRVK
jgi:murein DD-endopeptidase MepM/ murein hydrolase activator NlpD